MKWLRPFASCVAFAHAGATFAAYRILAEDMASDGYASSSVGSGGLNLIIGVLFLLACVCGLVFGSRRTRVFIAFAVGLPVFLGFMYERLWFMSMMFMWIPAMWVTDWVVGGDLPPPLPDEKADCRALDMARRGHDVENGAPYVTASRAVECPSCHEEFIVDEGTVWLYASVCRCPKCRQAVNVA